MIDINEPNIKEYKHYKIKKKNGKFREISAPNEKLKAEQRLILNNDLKRIKIKKYAKGFFDKRDIIENAKTHEGAHWILNMDLKDFFDTITKEKVYDSLINNNVSENRAEYIAEICTLNGSTPQGAPTSPYLSNIVFKPIDRKIQSLCSEHNCVYTRYADDITLSSKDKDNGFDTLQIIKNSVVSIIQKNGFKVNSKKTRTVGRHRNQEVTGITINDKISPSRKKVNWARGIIHRIEKDIENKTILTMQDLEEKYMPSDVLLGKINFIRHVDSKNEKYYIKLKNIYEQLKS